MSRIPILVLITAVSTVAIAADPAPPPRPVVRAVIESSLPTAKGNIRQFAFDGTNTTYFESARNAATDDHLTLTFDEPVWIRAVGLVSGRPDETDGLPNGGNLEVSSNGKDFRPLDALGEEKFARSIKAVRVRVIADLAHPLVIREFYVSSIPQAVPFRYPIEIALDVSDAPEMKAWGDKVVRICEREFPDQCAFLASDGYTPPTQLKMTLKNDYNGVAAAGGGRITGSVKYFKNNPNDIGAMVHETAHCVQNYRARGLPGWLVEGIADYVRFWRYEPGKAGRLQPERAKYDGSYRTTAAFLAFVTEKYDRQAVPKLNAMLRENRYTPEAWRTLTGKSVDELNQEWRQSLAR
jgi:hypothetical protein